MSKERKFTTFTEKVDDKDVEFKVYEPTLADQRESSKVRNGAFNDAVRSGAMLRAEIAQELEKRKIWNEDRQIKMDDLTEKIDTAEKRIDEGGFDLGEAKQLALDVVKWRADRRELMGDLASLNNETAEGQADNMAFNYLVSQCLVYNKEGTEVKFFADLEDYLNSTTNSTVAIVAANKLMELQYGISGDADKKLPENRFLIDFGFADDKLRLVNEDGHFVDVNGKLINEDNQFVDEDGNLIDKDGNLLNKDGSFKVEFKGFTTKDGQVVMGKSRQVANATDEGGDESPTSE
jgi:hypothetical protein